MVRSAHAILPIEPVVEGFFVNAETALAKPEHLEVFCIFAKTIGFANAYAKDFRHLLSGIGALRGIAANVLFHKIAPLQLGNYSGVLSTSFPSH